MWTTNLVQTPGGNTWPLKKPEEGNRQSGRSQNGPEESLGAQRRCPESRVVAMTFPLKRSTAKKFARFWSVRMVGEKKFAKVFGKFGRKNGREKKSFQQGQQHLGRSNTSHKEGGSHLREPLDGARH